MVRNFLKGKKLQEHDTAAYVKPKSTYQNYAANINMWKKTTQKLLIGLTIMSSINQKVHEVWDNRGSLWSLVEAIHLIQFCKTISVGNWHIFSLSKEYEC